MGPIVLHAGIQGRSSQAASQARLPSPRDCNWLEVSTYSQYKWVIAVIPTKAEKQSAEEVESKTQGFNAAYPRSADWKRAALCQKAARYFVGKPE